jgi:hypothetical protein
LTGTARAASARLRLPLASSLTNSPVRRSALRRTFAASRRPYRARLQNCAPAIVGCQRHGPTPQQFGTAAGRLAGSAPAGNSLRAAVPGPPFPGSICRRSPAAPSYACMARARASA